MIEPKRCCRSLPAVRARYSRVPDKHSPSLFCAFSRGAVPVPLLEDFLGAFHRRMLERIRIAGRDPPSRSFCTPSETLDGIGTVRAMGRVGESPRGVEGPKSSPPSEVGMRMQPENGGDRRSCGNELSKGAEKDCAGGADAASAGSTACTPREINLKSVGRLGRPLGDRDVNSHHSQAQPSEGCNAKTRGDRVSRTPAESNSTPTLIHDPFSLDERRRLTTDTALYKEWARSSSIVHDIRQDT